MRIEIKLKIFKKIRSFLNYERRIRFLRNMAEKKWPHESKVSYASKRNRYHPAKGRCLVCDLLRAACQHHMILLKNGGPDTSWNRLHICKYCHARIHPWLANWENERLFLKK